MAGDAFDVTTLARPEILRLKPYASARGTAAADGVLLNANEAPEVLVDDPLFGALALNRYPDPQPANLRDRLASLYGVAPEQVLVTRGSDEGIDLLVRVFCRAGRDAIAECPPCFGMYRIAAGVQGAGVVAVPRREDDLRVDVDALVRAIAEEQAVRLVFLTSPNNPTGDLLGAQELERVLDAATGRALVVLDEAYIEFTDAASACARIGATPHLVVLRTLSKAWAAAGLRCGAVVADPAVIDLLHRVMAPYPLTAPAIAAALAATSSRAVERQGEMLSGIAARRERLAGWLDGRAWVRRRWPGEANFLLVRVDDGPGLVRHCADRGVRIRDFSGQPGLGNCVRMTIGSDSDMAALYDALERYEGKP